MPLCKDSNLHRTPAFLFSQLWIAALVLSMVLAGCSVAAEMAPTATLLPTASPTPRPTASPTHTPLPLPSPTAPPPSPTSPPPTLTETPAPTLTPTRFGVIRSRQRVNVRRGPGVDFATFESLAPGTEVQVISQNADATWYSIMLDNEDEGWVRADLLFIEAAPTPSPTASPAADSNTPPAAATEGGLPVFHAPIVDIGAIHLTATALDSRSALTASAPENAPDSASAATVPSASEDIIEVPTRAANASRSGVDVFAFCDDSSYNIASPTNLSAGSSIEIFWAWFATSDDYLRQHIANASHELRVNGLRIANVDQFRLPPVTRGRDRVVYWYVPFGPLEAGDYLITYRVTWQTAITDGYKSFGPGTATEFEEESCNFVVR